MPKLEVLSMKKALRLASKGRGRTSPNPMVGAVLLHRGVIVGEGWHRGAGSPHAEREALAGAGVHAKGAVMYVTLEPCAHTGRTGPCTKAIIEAGISKVVIAMVDPDPKVRGKGIAELEAAGIEVEVGSLETEARRLNEAYVLHRSLGRPFVIYKAAATLDGRTNAADRSSKWISGEKARRDVQKLRSEVDAIVVGVETVLADDPSLTVRGSSKKTKPIRVVMDSRLRTPGDAKVLQGDESTLIFCEGDADTSRTHVLEAAGAEIISIGNDGGGLSVKQMLKVLAEREIVSVLLEGGATLAGSFQKEAIIDRYVLYFAPKIVGGLGSAGILEGWTARSIQEAHPLEIVSVKRIGEDVRVEAKPVRAL